MEWEEFCVLMFRKMREKDPENEIREAFRVFDAEGTGYIGENHNHHSQSHLLHLDAEEMRAILLQLPEPLSDEESFVQCFAIRSK